MSSQRRLLWGSRLVAAAYLVHFLVTLQSIVAVATGALHVEHVSNPATVTMWALSLSASWAFAEVLIAWFALPTGAMWAMLAACVPIFLTGIPRLMTDSACSANIFSVHGCHTFLGTEAAALMGLLLAMSGSPAVEVTETAARAEL